MAGEPCLCIAYDDGWMDCKVHPAAKVTAERPRIHLVEDSPFGQLEAICGQRLDGRNHTGHLSIVSGEDENCPDCVDLAEWGGDGNG